MKMISWVHQSLMSLDLKTALTLWLLGKKKTVQKLTIID